LLTGLKYEASFLAQCFITCATTVVTPVNQGIYFWDVSGFTWLLIVGHVEKSLNPGSLTLVTLIRILHTFIVVRFLHFLHATIVTARRLVWMMALFYLFQNQKPEEYNFKMNSNNQWQGHVTHVFEPSLFKIRKFQWPQISEISLITLMMEAVSFSEASVSIYQSTQCNMLEDSHL
jgi:hypothetical protein